MSEKFDGVRAFWDGEVLRTRTWRAIESPAWFTASLPSGIALDGELWGGRDSFQIASELARFHRATDAAWHRMRYMVFDFPTTEAIPLEQRLLLARKFSSGKQVEFVEQAKVESAPAMWSRFKDVVAGGGEGLVIRRPGSFYDFSRSSDWLKVKQAGAD